MPCLERDGALFGLISFLVLITKQNQTNHLTSLLLTKSNHCVTIGENSTYISEVMEDIDADAYKSDMFFLLGYTVYHSFPNPVGFIV